MHRRNWTLCSCCQRMSHFYLVFTHFMKFIRRAILNQPVCRGLDSTGVEYEHHEKHLHHTSTYCQFRRNSCEDTKPQEQWFKCSQMTQANKDFCLAKTSHQSMTQARKKTKHKRHRLLKRRNSQRLQPMA